MTDTQLLVATTNPGKVREVKSLLANCRHTLLFLSDLPHMLAEPEETGSSFAENAQIKSRYYSELSQLPTIADDSGLSVLELDGFPGINSARWVSGSNEDRVTALLKLLDDRGLTEPIQRRAYFSCCVCLSFPTADEAVTFEGECWGTLSHVPLGETGFGYDPIFVPDGETLTMAQLGMKVKNKISARSIAFTKLNTWLKQH